MKHPLIEFFHLSNLLQMLNNHRMVDVEFLGNFSCSCKRISFDDGSQMVTSDGQPLHSLSSRCFFAKLLEPPLPCTFISGSWAKCIVDVESCLPCFTTHSELKKEYKINIKYTASDVISKNYKARNVH